MLYRATYLHDRHVHDGLHSLDAAHGRLGHGAREIDRSVASRAKRPNAECPGNARGSSGERATFGRTRRCARGGVARATRSGWSPGKRPDDWRRDASDRASPRVLRWTNVAGLLQPGKFGRVMLRDEGVCPYDKNSTSTHQCDVSSIRQSMQRRQLTRASGSGRCTDVSLSPRGAAEGTQRASSPPSAVFREALPEREYPALRVLGARVADRRARL